MKEAKKFLLVKVLTLIKEGLNPSKISKVYKISKQSLNYYVGKLKQLGCIRKEGYGAWVFIKNLKEVKKVPIGTKQGQIFTSQKKKEIRGHAFIWKIAFFEDFDWKEVVNHYGGSTIKFKKISHGKVLRTIFQGRKIWLTANGMIIYEPLDFIGRSSFEVKGSAVFFMDLLIKDFLLRLGQKVRPYRFTTSREHFAMMKNSLAKQYNDKGEKMQIRDEKGTVWLWIDHSQGEQELETNNAVLSQGVQRLWNCHKKHKFKVDADFVLGSFHQAAEQIRSNAGQLEYFAENQVTHVKLMKNIDKNLAKQTEFFKQMKELLDKRDN